MLEAAGRRVLVGGNIGVPLSSQVDAVDRGHGARGRSEQLSAGNDRHVSSVDCGAAEFLARSSRSPSRARRRTARRRRACSRTRRADDWAVVNADNPPALALAARARARRAAATPLTTSPNAATFSSSVTSSGSGHPKARRRSCRCRRSSWPGRHMLSNVTAATAISHAAGARGDAMARALERVHRARARDGAGGQSSAACASSTTRRPPTSMPPRRSIESFDRVVAIVGGRYKGGAFEDLREPLRSRGRGVVAIGEAATAGAPGAGRRGAVRRGGHRCRRGGASAGSMARPDGVVLLAPACSSFDMFADYARSRDACSRKKCAAGAERSQ